MKVIAAAVLGVSVSLVSPVFASSYSTSASQLPRSVSVASQMLAYHHGVKHPRSVQSSHYGAGRTFVFSPRYHTWRVYENGRLVRSGVAAGGASYCRDIKRSCRTPTGYYRVLHKGGPNCGSTRYPRPHGGARMDYCMFFSKYYAVHGSNHVPAANVSHGCVRVQPAAARWLNQNFLRVGDRVIITSY